jgi:hypothetical protein
MVKEISKMFKAVGKSVMIEPRTVVEGLGNGGPDMLVLNFPNRYQTTSVEVSLVNPSQKALVQRAAKQPLLAADLRSRMKQRKYDKALSARKIFNRTAVMELPGAIHPELYDLVKECARIAATDPHCPYNQHRRIWSAQSFQQFYVQWMSVALKTIIFQGKVAKDIANLTPQVIIRDHRKASRVNAAGTSSQRQKAQ